MYLHINNSSVQLTAVTIQIFSVFKVEILRTQSSCSYVVNVVDASVSHFAYDLNAFGDSHYPQTNLIFPLLNSNLSKPRFTNQAPSHRYGACSLAYAEPSRFHVELLSEVTFDRSKFADNSAFQFYAFIFHFSGSDVGEESRILPFAKLTARILRTYFVTIFSDLSVKVFTQASNIRDLIKPDNYKLREISELPNPQILSLNLDKLQVDFQGSPLPVLFLCPACEDEIELFRVTGIWYNCPLGALYELSVRVNATLEIEEIFSSYGDGQLEDGSWDDWVRPVIEGKIAIIPLLKTSPQTFKAVHVTQTLVRGSSTFVTAGPRKLRGAQKLSKLISPISMPVWLIAFGALLGLFVLIEAALHLNRREANEGYIFRRLPYHLHRATISALLKPVLGQSGAHTKLFEHSMSGRDYRFLLGFWLVALIVLSCEYTSNMTSQVVLPMYRHPPSTFEELAYSDFKIFAMHWTGFIGKDFSSLNSNWSRTLISKTTEVDVVATDTGCFLWIFDDDAACLAYDSVIRTLAQSLLLDKYGRPTFVLARDSRFTTPGRLGISRHFPFLFDPCEATISGLEASGILSRWIENLEERQKKKGKMKARQLDNRDDILQKFEEEAKEDSIIVIIAPLVFYGMCLGSCVFICELLGKFRPMLRPLSRALIEARRRCLHSMWASNLKKTLLRGYFSTTGTGNATIQIWAEKVLKFTSCQSQKRSTSAIKSVESSVIEEDSIEKFQSADGKAIDEPEKIERS